MKSWDLVPFKETSIKVKVSLRLEDILELHFQINDPDNLMCWESVKETPERKQGLWEKTCLEFFSLIPEEKSYEEWNFSPSGDWNCFEFTDYRTPKTLKEKVTPAPEIISLKNEFKVKIPTFPPTKINLCAVVREKTGKTHYFSLFHDEKSGPDFHNSRLFLSL